MGEIITPLKEINISIEPGDFVAIEGPSGVGKSTLLYILGALMQPDDGVYLFEGEDVSKLDDREISQLRANKIGFMFQNTNLVQALTLRENLEFAAKIGKNSMRDVDALLVRFGLDDRADHLPYQLSGGQRRRAAAIRSIMHSPALILADEPTNDLDEHWSEVMIELLREEAKRGASVVLVTHNRALAEQATKRYRLEDGMLIEYKGEAK